MRLFLGLNVYYPQLVRCSYDHDYINGYRITDWAVLVDGLYFLGSRAWQDLSFTGIQYFTILLLFHGSIR